MKRNNLKIIILLLLITILSGCTKKTFYVNNSNNSCDTIRSKINHLILKQVKVNDSSMERLNEGLKHCYYREDISENDYNKYKQLLNEMNDMSSEFDSIIKDGTEIYLKK